MSVRAFSVAGLCACALGACGSSTTARTASARFTPNPRTVQLHVGDTLEVRKSLGECGPPTSSNPSVIVAEHPPPVGDCSQTTVSFKAVGTGAAEIAGQMPCHGTECAAIRALIPVQVSGS